MTRIYFFSPIPYTFLHQRPQRLADQFIARGIDVTYIEPFGLTEHLGGHPGRLLRLLLFSAWCQVLTLLSIVIPFRPGKSRGRAGRHPGARGLTILTLPLVLPHTRVNSAFLEKMNAAVFREVLDRKVLGRMQQDERSVAVVENPYWGSVLRKGDFTFIAYDCLDEMVLFSGRGSLKRYEEYERRLLEIADATFVTAEQLEATLRTRGVRSPLIRIPNGVDYEWFQERSDQGDVPGDLAAIPAPIAGYVGVLRAWFDYELIGRLAAGMRDISFVIVGPLDIRGKIKDLLDLPNLFWLGRREYQDIPLFVRAFDVCLIPFTGSSISMTTNPVKVFEYFALGKPVVSSPLRELRGYANEGILRVAEGEREFASAIRESLGKSDPHQSERRRAIARAHSWQVLAGEMLTNLGIGTET